MLLGTTVNGEALPNKKPDCAMRLTILLPLRRESNRSCERTDRTRLHGNERFTSARYRERFTAA